MTDPIERQAAIDTFHAFAPGIPWDALDKIFAEIPSAQPEEVFKIGKPYPLKGFEFKIWKDAYGDDWVEIREYQESRKGEQDG